MNAARLGAAAVVFGAAGLVLAYSFGWYDLSFLDRSDLIGEILEEPAPSQTGSPSPSGSTSKEPGAKETVSSVPAPAESSSVPETESPSAAKPTETKSVLGIYDSALLPDVYSAVPLLSEVSDTDSEARLARIRFGFKLPSDFSVSQRTAEQLSYIIPGTYAPYEALYTTVWEDQPAIELYMGMILIDTGTSVVIADGNGTPLCSFDDEVYKPAYTRDRSGRPLFVKESADGKKTYFYLSDDGQNFIRSDYDDKTDGRGLYFDYPADWGLSDNWIKREYDEEEEKWVYRTGDSTLTETKYDEAYDFSEGFACVTSPTEDNRGGMYFISQYGWLLQQTFVTFKSNLENRHFIWDYALPASRGLESIGFFYFDHGLTRVRYQVIDYYSWSIDNVMVITEEDRLLRTDGTFLELPNGYTLKGYSDGMILLEKDGLYGFLDYTGGWIASPCYASATPFLGGYAVLETADGRFGMIDTEGNIVLPFTYDHISMVSGDLVAAYREENGWTVMKILGNG